MDTFKKLGVLTLLGSLPLTASAAEDRYLGPEDYIDGVVLLEQGWDNEARDRFYHEPQGSPIMPYDWFLKLEQPDSEALFRDNGYLRSFGMITTQQSSARNPDALPVGLTKDLGIYGIEPKLGMNCGACHVTEVTAGGKTVLIDGGASHFNFWSFMAELLESLEATHRIDDKFERFANAVLEDDATDARKAELRRRLGGVLQTRQNWAERNAADVEPGPGRVDALNVILNEVTAMMIHRPDNARPSNAPVSYPFVWDAPYLDYVQYNAAVPNAGAGAMGRNVGQVLGVFGEVSIINADVPPGYPSSVRMDHLVILEQTMETLWSPSWSEMADKGLLPALDQGLVDTGKTLYGEHCASCHVLIDRTNQGDLASIKTSRIPWDEIGTDSVATLDFGAREVATGPLYQRAADFIAGEPLCRRTHADQLLAHMTAGAMMHKLEITGKPIAKTLVEQLYDQVVSAIKNFFSPSSHEKQAPTESDQHLIARMSEEGFSEADITEALEARSSDKAALYADLVADGLRSSDEDRACLEVLQSAVYRGRPLNGIWSTGPFLHNGSVPSLQALLLPPDERPKTFHVGSTEIDADGVGFVNAPGPRTMEFDTSIKGNGNGGHNYGTSLDQAERRALLEYLKSL